MDNYLWLKPLRNCSSGNIISFLGRLDMAFTSAKLRSARSVPEGKESRSEASPSRPTGSSEERPLFPLKRVGFQPELFTELIINN